MRLFRLFAVLVALALLGPALAIGVAAAPAGVAGRSLTRAQGTTCPNADYPTETIQIMAPAAPGGGWDTTAREVQAVLQGDRRRERRGLQRRGGRRHHWAGPDGQ